MQLLGQLSAATDSWQARFGCTPRLRLGIDTGRVVVGAAGAGAWTTVDSVFGDPPHVAARLQGLAAANSIVISQATFNLVERHFELEPLGPQHLSGYSQPMAAYQVLRARDLPRAPSGLPSLVDRQEEARQLEQLWAAVQHQQREEVLVLGEAGVGKSRLIEHLANVAIATSGRVISIHCAEAFRHSALHPVASTLRRLLGGSAPSGWSPQRVQRVLLRIGMEGELISRAMVPLTSLLDQRQSADVLPQQLRAALFEVLVAMIDRLGEGKPLLLVLEDLHYADPSTVQFANFVRERSAAPLLLVVSARPPGASLALRRTLTLGALAESDARSLALRCAPDLDEGKLRVVLGGAAGMPLFLTDLARGIAIGGSLLTTPSATTSLLTHRLDQLDPDSRTLVNDMAVLGTECTFPVLAAITELSTERLERALARTLHDGLLVASTTDQGSSFQFRHRLYQEVAYDAQLLQARKRRHARCADALIALASPSEEGGTPPEVIANHLTLSHRDQEAVGYWQQAGERAAAAAAHAEATVHFEHALSALSSRAPSAERMGLELGLRLAYGASCAAAYGYADERVMDTYTRATAIGAAAPDGTALLPALWGIWSYYVVRSLHSQALDLTERCLALASAGRTPGAREVAAAISGTQYVYLGRWREAKAELMLAVQAGGPLAQLFPQDPALASRALLAVVLWVLGEEVQSRQELESTLTAVAALRGRQAEFTRAYVYCFAAWYAQLNDDPVRALQLGQQALAIAQRHNFETWLGAAALHIAGGLGSVGDFGNSLPLFANALGQWESAGARLMLPYFWGRYGQALVASGKLDEGLDAFRRALALSASTGEVFYDAELHRLRAEALAATRAPDAEVIAEIHAAQSVATAQHAEALAQRARRPLGVSNP